MSYIMFDWKRRGTESSSKKLAFVCYMATFFIMQMKLYLRDSEDLTSVKKAHERNFSRKKWNSVSCKE